MLNPTKAQETLDSLKVKDAEKRRLERVAGLPASLRAIGFGVVGRKEDGKEDNTVRWWERRRAASVKLAGLSKEERIEVFGAMSPALAAPIEAGWSLHDRLPYQIEAGRRAFRAPNRPELLVEAKSNWVDQVLNVTSDYDQDIVWCAAWAPYLSWGADSLGRAFAATIDAGGAEADSVFNILTASAKGDHEIGAMGRHVTRGLLTASRPDGWELMEKYLLAAQRQEGLRQVVLETIDEAHPEAFRRMLHLILDQDLLRFSATLRAVDVWFGFGFDVETLTLKAGNALLSQVLRFIEDPEARRYAIEHADAQEAYLALCASAYEDAPATVQAADELLCDDSVERRFVGAKFLGELDLPESHLNSLPALQDADLRVAWKAFETVNGSQESIPGLFEALEAFIVRIPKNTLALDPIVWPWTRITPDVHDVARALKDCCGDRSAVRLIPYLSLMETWTRSSAVETLAKQRPITAEIRKALLSLVGDTSEDVRSAALKGLEKSFVSPNEAQTLEPLLKRKAESLRRGVLTLLLKQKDAETFASADRLLNASAAPVRQAGLEMLQQMITAERRPQECRDRAAQYRTARPTADESEAKLLEALLNEERETPTLDNGLGLFDPTTCSPAIPPRPVAEIWKHEEKRNLLQKLAAAIKGAETGLKSGAPAAVLASLQAVLKKHKQTPLTFEQWDGQKSEQLLGDITYFPIPNNRSNLEEDLKRLPGREIWEQWERERTDKERDKDGLELLRLAAGISAIDQRSSYYSKSKSLQWVDGIVDQLCVALPSGIKQLDTIGAVVNWMLRIRLPEGAFDFLLNALETTFNLIPADELPRVPKSDNWYEAQGWRGNQRLLIWFNILGQARQFHSAQWTDAHERRLWALRHWMDRPAPGAARHRPDIGTTLGAFHRGDANEADVFDQLIGPQPSEQNYYSSNFSDLHMLTGRKPHALLADRPSAAEIVDRCRDRILEVELGRGDMPTAASLAAASLRTVHGVARLAEFMRALGHKEAFVRSGADNIQTRRSVFSHIIRSTFPLPNETAADFAAQMQAIKAPPTRLVELAVFAPQWSRFVEAALEWPELEEAVWWVHAHTKDHGWSVDADIRDEWNAASAERTPLTGDDLLAGAVDVTWFHRVYGALGPDRWAAVDAAAKYASGGGGHKRAQLFADAMLGKVTEDEMLGRITEKRNGDAVRALGLVPVPEGESSRRETLLRRYKAIQEFLRTSKQFGAQRQESEKKASTIALENLARSAGYPDPSRLQWAMEAEAVADLAAGPVSITLDGVTVTLSINILGKPDISIEKAGKPLKTVPPKVKKDPEIATLFERRKEIERQGSRIRLSLEQAMCRGDHFTASELEELCAHPLLRPMLGSVVFMGDDGAAPMGYPVEKGRALEGHDGTTKAVAPGSHVRIAHPYDLLKSGEWHLWQRECFLRERIQPFKQVFRELYVLTEAEQKEQKYSVRYDGHQVMPQRAMALAGSRGWINVYEEGIRRTFHAENITAWLTFDRYFTTPAEVEGLTVQQVYFTKRGEWKPLDLADVPQRVFSEAMRDVDLVVSVAHAGGIDPEASASTIEMRESLLRETLRLLKIGNVRFQSVHALIEGKLGDYSVHMGSAVVHRQPGGHLCIVPVSGQNRGRLFLPFTDDDPKSAEVVSKVLLLAKDSEINDPTILEQILPRG